jgi:mRNA interferase MazF
MKFGNYVPERGDIVWLDFEPQKGTEIKKTRPALTLSPKSYNSKTGLGLFVPITSSIKGYPFEVNFTDKYIKGVILADQIKSLDWRVRNAKKITRVEKKAIHESLRKASLLLQ